MPVELNITDTAVILESASEPGPAGPGVPTGGTVGQVLTKDSSTDYDTSWQDPTGGGGGGAPTTVDYLVGTASGSLSAEIVVGTSPGGELGGTWASPTVDATHSGSSHASVQAAAEATAAAALSAHLTDTTDAHDASAISSVAAGNLAATDVQAALNELDSEKAASTHVHAGEDITSGTVADARIASTIARDSEVTSAIATHEADTTSVHGIADTSALALTANHPSNATFNDHSARHENGGADEISIAGLDGTSTELAAHLADATAAHAASAISFTPNGSIAATDVQAAIQEVRDEAGGGGAPTDATYITQTANGTLSNEQALSALSTGIVKVTTTTGVLSTAVANTDYAAATHATRHENGGADEISIAGLDGTSTELAAHLADTTAAHAATAISFSPDGSISATTVQAAIVEVRDEIGAETLLYFSPLTNEPPATNFATLDTRNSHPCLDFDTTTQEAAVFTGLMPRSYGGGGITVYLHWAATSATSGTIGWDVALERIGDGSQDVDSDGFATAQTVTAATVPGTSGLVDITNVAITNGANMDSVAAGELFRVRVRRDVANDTATGDAELYGVEIKETT